MSSNNADAQQTGAILDSADYEIQFEDEREGAHGAVRTTKLVSFHDLSLSDLPRGLLDDVMRDLFNTTEERRFREVNNGQDWFVYHTHRTLDRETGAPEDLHGITLTFWVSIKPIPGAKGPGNSYEGQIVAVNKSPYPAGAPAARPGPPPSASFRMSIIDDDDARAILDQIREKVAGCAAALNAYDQNGDSSQLQRQTARLKEAALLMDRVESHHSLADY